VFSDPLLK